MSFRAFFLFILIFAFLPVSSFGQLQRLTFRPVDAEYSQALDRVILISSNPNQLHIYDPATNAALSLPLASAPLSLSLSVDGRRAAVGHDQLVSYVDLTSLSVIRTYPVSVKVVDAIPGANWIYVTNLGSLRISDGTISGGGIGYYGNIKGRLHPSGQVIYGTRDGLSPNDVERYDVSTGPFTVYADTPYHGDYNFCGNVWFNPAADRIYTSCGTIVRAAPKQPNDMYFRGMLRGANYIRSLTESSQHLAILEDASNNTSPANLVRIFDPVQLLPTGGLRVPDFVVGNRNFASQGRWIFFNNQGSRLFAIVQADSTSGLLNDFAVYTFDFNNSGTCSANFQPASTILIQAHGGVTSRTLDHTADCVYQPTSSVPWIRIRDLRFGRGPQTLSLHVLPNPTNAARSGEVRIGGQTLRVDQDPAPTTPPSLQRLDFKVRDVEYDKTLDRVVAVSDTFPELVVYNPDAPAQSLRIPLPQAGLSVGVAPGGRFAAVGHDGFISHVNLETGAVLRSYEIDTDVNDIVYSANGYFYGVPVRTWSDAYSVSISTGLVTAVSAIYDGRVMRRHPGNRFLYFAGGDASKWDTASGTLQQVSTWIYNGYYGAANIWISEDGNRIFASDSKVYRASDVPAEDVQPNGSLSAAVDIGTRWADHSSSLKSIAIVPGRNAWWSNTPETTDREVQLYSDEALTFTGRLALGRVTIGANTFATGGRYLFWNRAATGLVVVSQVESAANLASDFALEVIRDRPCPQLTLPVSTLNRTADAFQYSIAVNAAPGCMWIAQSNAPWITVTDQATGAGESGQVQIRAGVNVTGETRLGTVTIGTKTFIVSQAASTTTVRINPTSMLFESNASAAGFTVEASAGFQWTATSDQPWLTVTSGSTGTGNGSVAVFATENTSTASRVATVTIAGLKQTVSQSGRFSSGNRPLRLVPMPPCRVADTRLATGPFGGPVMQPQEVRSFDIPSGPCANIPASAKSYALNVTVVPRGPLGFLTLFPKGSSRPVVSTLNSLDGRIKANAAVVSAGTQGGVSVYVTDLADVILDITGYFVDSSERPDGLMFYPLPPCRVTDTRLSGQGPAMTAIETRTIKIAGTCSVPVTAQAYSLNATVVPSGPLGFITMWNAGTSRPTVSNLNALNGGVVANAAIVPAGQDGSISVYATDRTHLVLDINGYFAAPASQGLNFYATPPCRLMDTRLPNGEFGSPILPFQTVRTVSPARALCQVVATAQAVSLNATVVPPAPLSFLTLFPDGISLPVVSTLNAVDGSITSNAAVVPVSPSGWLAIYATHSTHLLLDLNGFFAP